MQPIRFLALGDSYTIGAGVPESRRWPVQLVKRLRMEGWTVGDPLIVARTGWTAVELQSEMVQANLEGPFDLVMLLIGVNDQYRGGAPEVYRRDFRNLLGNAIQFSGEKPDRVIVLSIPDWGVTPFAEGRDRDKIAVEIDAFNAINWEVSREKGVKFIDLTSLSRQASQRLSWIAEDGLHPSGQMYAAWVELMSPVVMDILKGLNALDIQGSGTDG
jgi:lysophospholipase L1-like esterase